METIMRIIALATLLTAALSASSASAQGQGDYRHHKFCMRTGSGEECAYDTMAQCQAARNGANDSCVPNSSPQDH
jgi:hypothetical protein